MRFQIIAFLLTFYTRQTVSLLEPSVLSRMVKAWQPVARRFTVNSTHFSV